MASQDREAVSSLLNRAIRLLGDTGDQAETSQAQEPNRNQRVADNFRRCFPSLSGIRPSPYSTQDRPRRGRSRSFVGVPLNTWTHDTCLLALRNEDVAPNRDRLDKLKCAGLGKKRITFNKRGDHAYFIKKLEEEFPKLKDQHGAIEVLRSTTGGSGIRPIIPIPIGSQGYSIQELRSSINSATLYVRPLQTDIDLDQVTQVTSEIPKVTCIHCGKEVSLPDLRVHNQSQECTLARPGTSSDEMSFAELRVPENIPGTDCARPGTSSDDVSFAELDLPEYIPEAGCARPGTNMSSPAVFQSASAGSLAIKLEVLKEMFPNVPDEKLSKVANESLTMDDAIDELVGQCHEHSGQTLNQLLTEYRTQLKEEELNITVERDNIWCNILSFYKKSLTDKQRLRKKLVVAFIGEDGVDAGALSVEFFQLALDQIKKRLFQGKQERVLPIKDSSKSSLFRIAGTIVAHSVLQNGPSFPCLCPALYQYLVGKCEDAAIHLNHDDIPLTAGTEAVVNLIKQIDDCETADDLSNCLSDDIAWNVISASHWPNEVCITLNNKATLVANMVEQEVLWSRKQELDEFGAGLESLGLRTILRRNPDACSRLLCFDENADFGPEEFEKCLSRPAQEPDDFVQAQAYGWFNSYINENPKSDSFQGGCRLKALLQFSTGYQVPPPGENLPHKISVSFLPDDDKHQLPISQACFGYLKIPTVHSSRVTFYEFMDMALTYGGAGFGMF